MPSEEKDTRVLKIFDVNNLERWDESVTEIGSLRRDITPSVMGPWPLFCHYTFLTLETKSGISFIKVGP